MSTRLDQARISGLHASLIIRGLLPYTPLARSRSQFRAALVERRGPWPVRHFALSCIDSVADYAELAARMLFTAGLAVDQLAVNEVLEGTVEFRVSRDGFLFRSHWVQRGPDVHQAFFEALDALTMPEGRFVRFAPGGDHYLGIYLPTDLADKAEAVLGDER